MPAPDRLSRVFSIRRWTCLAPAVALAGLAVLLLGPAAHPAVAASPREIKEAIDAAEKLFDEGKGGDAAARLTEAVRGLEEAARADRVPSTMRILARRCSDLRKKLDDSGVDVAAITVPTMVGGPKTGDAKPDPPAAAASARAPAASGVSFTRDIAPLLVRSCGGCHVGGKKGDFHIPCYADLMRSGMVQRGAGQASRIVEVIATGDMPRGGGKVAADDLAKLVRWIDAGAAYDGNDPSLPLASLGRPAAPAAKPGAAAAADVVTLKPGDVSFASQVAPVLIDSCLTCHGGFETEAGFSLNTFQRLLRGGGSGAVIEPGSSADSLLVKKIRGMGIEGQRMPLGKPPLPKESVALIAKWIDEGARLDARAADGDLRTIAAIGRAASLSHDELTAVRRKAAAEYWRQFLPDEEGRSADHGDLTVIGNLPQTRMDDLAETADSLWQRVAERLTKGDAARSAAGSRPLKGGVVLYVFARAYDFSEFWLARYSVERPRGATTTAGVVGDVVYAAVAVPSGVADTSNGKDSDLTFTIAEQLTAATFIARGAPTWFAEGAGRTLAADLVGKAPLAREWREGLPAAVSAAGSAENVIAGRCEPAAGESVAAGFVERISAKGSRLPDVLAALAAGSDFEETFAKTFGGPPKALLDAWMRQEGSRSRRR